MKNFPQVDLLAYNKEDISKEERWKGIDVDSVGVNYKTHGHVHSRATPFPLLVRQENPSSEGQVENTRRKFFIYLSSIAIERVSRGHRGHEYLPSRGGVVPTFRDAAIRGRTKSTTQSGEGMR